MKILHFQAAVVLFFFVMYYHSIGYSPTLCLHTMIFDVVLKCAIVGYGRSPTFQFRNVHEENCIFDVLPKVSTINVSVLLFALCLLTNRMHLILKFHCLVVSCTQVCCFLLFQCVCKPLYPKKRKEYLILKRNASSKMKRYIIIKEAYIIFLLE